MSTSSSAFQPALGLFEPVLDQHEDLERLFIDHQCALMALDLSRALEVLGQFEALLARHMAFEEDLLMPAWEAQGGSAERLGPDLLADEHQKLVKRLATLRASVEQLAQNPNLGHRDIIELLDEELRYKRLLHHHDERERLGLYPFLDEQLPAELLDSLRPQVAAYLTRD